jgi:hypothetical protein
MIYLAPYEIMEMICLQIPDSHVGWDRKDRLRGWVFKVKKGEIVYTLFIEGYLLATLSYEEIIKEVLKLCAILKSKLMEK